MLRLLNVNVSWPLHLIGGLRGESNRRQAEAQLDRQRERALYELLLVVEQVELAFERRGLEIRQIALTEIVSRIGFLRGVRLLRRARRRAPRPIEIGGDLAILDDQAPGGSIRIVEPRLIFGAQLSARHLRRFNACLVAIENRQIERRLWSGRADL